MSSPSKTNILLVDDRPNNLLALQSILEPLGQNLVLAESGEDALRRVLEAEFAVILLDVLMPGMDGFETAKLIKQRERTRHTPIIFLTAVSQHEQHVFRGYDVGAVDYITKPLNAEILRSKVAVFVELFSKNAQLRRQSELLRENEARERVREVAEQKRLGAQRYEQLAESMPQIVWTADENGHIVYCNRRCIEFTGLSAEELREHGWQTALDSAHVDEFVSGWKQAVTSSTSYEASFRLKHAQDGVLRWHLLRALPVRDALGQVSWIGTSTDIDDQKRAADALSFLAEASTLLATSLDYRSAARRIPDLAVPVIADWCAIDLIEEDGTVQRVASAHIDPEQLRVLASLRSRFPPKLRSSLRGLSRVLSGGGTEFVPWATDDFLREASYGADHFEALRGVRIASYVCSPLVARGKILGAITLASCESNRRYGEQDRVLCEDVARRIASAIDNARLYEIAERERKALEHANQAKDQFLAVVSHELRSPLNSVLGWTQLLRMGKLDAATREEALATIERNARAQSHLLEDLLDVSRIITGKLQLNMQTLEFPAVVDAALNSVRPAAQAKGIELLSSFQNEIPWLIGDSDRLQQVVWNLLSNAIKFTPRGGRIEVTLESRGPVVVLEVRDNGIGIGAELLPHVFERLRQGDSSNTRAHGGLGLGLSIVRHLAELHGGEVRAESAGEGRGSTFTLELPGTATLLQSPAAGGSGEPASTRTTSRVEPLQGLNILVVEDLEDARELLRTLLRGAGAAVAAVANVRQALEAIERRVPDVLISDIGLPHENGYDLLKKVRALPVDRGGNIPAIAVTAFASEKDRRDALSSGFHGHVAKPVDARALLELIADLRGPAPNPPGNVGRRSANL